MREIIAVAAFLAALVAAAAWHFYSSGYLLYYGDAQAHLNISRSIIDSRTPGYDQLGTVWLPVLHLICLPFVRNDFLWHTGLAATFPVGVCFVITGVSLYLCGSEVFQNRMAAAVGLLCFALNPNILYLATISMTEIVFAAGLTVCLLAILRFRKTQRVAWVALAIAASWWMSLTRYDGWFLIPFVGLALMLAAQRRKFAILVVTGALASLAPVYWMAHNWWEESNPLDFYNGPYSAATIQGFRPYPGLHNWLQAFHQYWVAGRDCSGTALLVLGCIGVIASLLRGPRLAVCFLALTPVFYIWSVHSSWTPVFVPSLWPFSYYNTRYGMAVVLLMSLGAATLAAILPRQARGLGLFVPLIALLPWLITPNHNNWICWKESEQNSIGRRAWTAEAATYLQESFHSGDGILLEFGDVAGILCKAEVPLREALHEGNGPMWFANTMPNGLMREPKWAIAQEGGKLAARLAQSKSYSVVKIIAVPKAPRLFLYQRQNPNIL